MMRFSINEIREKIRAQEVKAAKAATADAQMAQKELESIRKDREAFEKRNALNTAIKREKMALMKAQYPVIGKAADVIGNSIKKAFDKQANPSIAENEKIEAPKAENPNAFKSKDPFKVDKDYFRL